MKDKDLNHEQYPLRSKKPLSEADEGGGYRRYPTTHIGVGIWNASDLDVNAYNSFGSRLTARITEILEGYRMITRKPGNLEQVWENGMFAVVLHPRHGGNCHTLIVEMDTKDQDNYPLLEKASRRIFNTLVADGYTVTEADRKTGRQVPYTIQP